MAQLTEKQRRFVEEYLLDLNATAAAGRAGYSEPSIGRRLVAKSHVQEAIQAALATRTRAAEISAEQVLRELALIATSDIGDILDFTSADGVARLKPVNQIPEKARRTIASAKVRRYTEGHGDDARQVEVTEFRLWPKGEALRDLGRYFKLFLDRIQVSASPTTLEVIEEIVDATSQDGPRGSQEDQPKDDPAP